MPSFVEAPSASTKHSDRTANTSNGKCTTLKSTWDSKFQKKGSWIAFGLIVLLVVAFNIPFYIHSLSISPNKFEVVALEIDAESKALELEGYNIYVNPNLTKEQKGFLLYELSLKGEALAERYKEVVKNKHRVWIYCMVTGGISLAVWFMVMIFVYFHRHSKAVRSRGKYFLIQITTTSFFLIVVSMLQSSMVLFEVKSLNPPKDATNEEKKKLAIAIYVVGLFIIFFAQSFFAAITCRMRLVYLAYNSRKNDIKKNQYFRPLPICGLIYAISTLSYHIGVFKEDEDGYTSFPTWLYASTFFGVAVYFSWISFYSYKCRNAASQFSDLMINIRCGFVYTLGITVITILYIALPSSMACYISWQYFFQMFSIIYLLDQFSSLGYLYYRGEMTSGSSSTTQQRTSKTTHRSRTTTASHATNRNNITQDEMMHNSVVELDDKYYDDRIDSLENIKEINVDQTDNDLNVICLEEAESV